MVNQVEEGDCQEHVEQKLPQQSGDKYIVSPKDAADQENEDEEMSYDLTTEFADEPGAELMSLADIKRLKGDDLEVWKKAMQDEVES